MVGDLPLEFRVAVGISLLGAGCLLITAAVMGLSPGVVARQFILSFEEPGSCNDENEDGS